MNKFVYNPNEYTANNFTPIAEGDHRVRISNVSYQTFSNGKPGYEITLDVSGYNSKLWHYITIDLQDTKKTNQRLGSFFNSFGVTDYNLDNCNHWIGKYGAVRVRHDIYQGRTIARVAFCLSRDQQDRLPRWQNDNDYVPDDTYDFCNSVTATKSVPRRQMNFNGFEF
jgi:hypothetical protein